MFFCESHKASDNHRVLSPCPRRISLAFLSLYAETQFRYSLSNFAHQPKHLIDYRRVSVLLNQSLSLIHKYRAIGRWDCSFQNSVLMDPSANDKPRNLDLLYAWQVAEKSSFPHDSHFLLLKTELREVAVVV